ncbi:MAG: hypothetical protein ACI81L_000448 [Verrucomicrobiales bacterium]|jgi:hypothetical protein
MIPLTLVAIAIGALLVFEPKIALGATILCVAFAVLLHRRTDLRIVVSSAFFLLVLIPELSVARPVVPLVGTSVYIPHLLIFAVLPVVDWSAFTRGFRRLLAGYVGIVGWMAIWGLANGGALTAVLQDVRGPLSFFGGVVCALALYQQGGLRSVLNLVPITLGVSVALIGFQATTGLEILGGRVSDAVGFGGVGRAGAAIDATRFIVSSEDLAVASLLVVFWWLTKNKYLQPSRILLWLVAASSVSIMVLSLSRQLLVGLAVGLIAWMLVRGGFKQSAHMVAVALPFILAAIVGLALLSIAGQGIGSSSVVGKQIDGFSERVLNGFTSESLQQDAGSSWRQRENTYAIDVIVSQPLGTGLGRPYRPELEIEAFGDPTFFRRWVHNVYLWYGTKGGGLGLLAVALVTVVPFIVALRRARRPGPIDDPVAEAAVPILLAFGVMSLVDPVIINSNSGVITGALFALLGLRTRPAFAAVSGQPDDAGQSVERAVR